jgi:CRP-like cAMP-binding protein
MTADRTPIEGLLRKLKRVGLLNADDIAALRALPMRIERVRRFQLLVREGATPDRCCLLVRGYADRYKETPSGKRQIVSFHIAGDLLDIQHLLLAKADHSVEAITPADVAWIPKSDLVRLAQERPAVGQALWRDCLIDASVFREWVLNVGQRDSRSRIAHMLCELAARCEAAGLGDRHVFAFPMTQQQIADATGLTSVHVNRTLKALDAEGALSTGRQIRIRNWDHLCSIAAFDPTYLHAAA